MAQSRIFPEKLSVQELEQWLWDAACSIRGPVDAPKFKDYILPLLFFKRLSDVFEDEEERLKAEFGDETIAREIIEQDRKLVRFYLPDGCAWKDIRKVTKNLGEELTKALRRTAKENPKLQGVIDIVDFNATVSGERIIDDGRLSNLVEIISRYRLGLDDVEPDILGRAYEYLLRKFAEGSGQSAGEFYTPKEVAWLMANLIRPEQGEEIYDPACGSGGLLVKCQLVLKQKPESAEIPLQLYGQEINPVTYAMAKMNMIIHDMEGEIRIGDTLKNPKFVEDNTIKRFDKVTANPMWNQKEYNAQFKLFKQVEEIYEILSPDVFLRDYLEAYKSLGQLYKVVQNMFRPKEADLYRDLRNKTKELIRKHVNLEAIMESLPAYKIDEKVIEKVERERLPERAKVVNLYRSIILHVQANVRRDHVANDPDNTKPENSNKRKILNWLLLALLGTATIGTAAVIGKYVTTNPEVKNVQTDKKRYLPGETVKITGSTSQAESIRAEVVGPGGFRQTPFLGLENSLFGLNFTTRADLEGLYNATLTADVNIVPFITKSSSLTTSIPVFDDPAISLNYSRVAKPGMEVPISIFARDTSDITRMLIEYGGTNVSIPFTPSNRVNASYILRLDNSEGDYGFRIFAFDKFGNVGVNGGSVTSRLTDLDRLVMLGLENGVSEQGVLSLYNSVPQLLELVKSDSGRESLVKFFKVAKSNPDIASQIADISYRDRSFPSIGFATKLAELSDDAIEIHYDKPSLRISRTTANAQGNVTLYTLISGLPQHSVEVRHLLGNATELDSDMVYNFRPMNYYTLAKHLGLSPEILQRPELLESFGDKIKAEDYLFYELLGQSISNQEIWQKRLALLDYQLGLPSDIRVIPLDKPSLVRKYPSRADREEISMNMWAPAEWAFIDGDGGRGAYSSTPSLQKVYKNIEKVVSGEWLQSYLQAYNNLSSELHRRVEQFLSEHTDPDNWAKLAEGWYSVAKMFKKYDTIQKTIPEINRLRFLYGLVGQDINVIEQDRAYATVVRAPAIGGSVSVARAPYPTGGGFHSEPVFPIPIEVLNIFLSDSTTYGKPIILKGQGISFIYCEEDSFISGYSSRPFLEQLSLPRRETYRRNF